MESFLRQGEKLVDALAEAVGENEGKEGGRDVLPRLDGANGLSGDTTKFC